MVRLVSLNDTSHQKPLCFYHSRICVKEFYISPLDHVTAPESQSLTIPCGRSNKADIHVLSKDDSVIYFDGEIRSQNEIYSLDEQGNLVLSSAVPEDSGIYKCYGPDSLYKVLNVTGTIHM